MKTSTASLLGYFKARRLRIFQAARVPHNPAEGIRRMADLRHNVAREVRRQRTQRAA